MSDQINTNLKNKVELIGKLAEFEMEEGTTKGDKDSPSVPYVSCKGVVQYGSEGVQARKFQCYVNKFTREGKENKLYTPIKNFGTKNGDKSIAKVGYDDAIEVSLEGSLSPNIYYSDTANNVIDTLVTNIKFLNTKKSTEEENGAFVSIEAYLKKIDPEIKNDEETGRLKITLVSATYGGEAIVIDNVIVPAELADDFTDLYEMGKTGEFCMQYITHVEKTKKTGGLGAQRSADKVYTELVLIGASEPYDEEDEKTFTFSKEVVKILLAEKSAKVEQIKQEGEGGKSISSSAKNKGLPNSKKANITTDESDDEIPF